MVGHSPKRLIRRGTTGISHIRCGIAKRGCASRFPPRPARWRAAREGCWWRARPHSFVAGASPARVKRRVQWRAINPPLGGAAPSTLISAGRPKCDGLLSGCPAYPEIGLSPDFEPASPWPGRAKALNCNLDIKPLRASEFPKLVYGILNWGSDRRAQEDRRLESCRLRRPARSLDCLEV